MVFRTTQERMSSKSATIHQTIFSFQAETLSSQFDIDTAIPHTTIAHIAISSQSLTRIENICQI